MKNNLRFRRYTSIILTLAVLIAVGTIVVFVVQMNSFIARSEESYHAHRLVFDLLGEHLENQDGKWPTSWEDLKKLSRQDFGGLCWPRDVHTVQKYVYVDFNADADHLLTESPKTFSGVKSVTLYYSYEPEIEDLLKKLGKRDPASAQIQEP